MTSISRRLILSWLSGIVVGTAIIAATSPLFVRSYVPLQADLVRGVWTLPAGATYRWRSEGYADTQIGPLGMPGKTSIPGRQAGVLRIGLWGDSQTEGVCVDDRQKLFAQAESSSGGRLQVFPLARSGEDAADWLTQMPAVEAALDLDAHVLMIVDLNDLLTATDAPVAAPSAADVAAGNASIAARVPAFVIQAARHLLTESDEFTPRRLQFSLGPRHANPRSASAATLASDSAPVWDDAARPEQWRTSLRAIRQRSTLPMVILQAPVTPQIVGGEITHVPQFDRESFAMANAAREFGVQVVSAASELEQSAAAGRWPHGFHNGYFGSGHLNATGNAVVASVLIESVLRSLAANELPSIETPSNGNSSPEEVLRQGDD